MSQSEAMFQTIGKIKLKNNGGFVARMQFEYFNFPSGQWIHVDGTGDITVCFAQEVDPGKFGVPNGSLVKLHVSVVWGRDNEAKEMFMYEKGSDYMADYAISGTTLDNTLIFKGLVSSPMMRSGLEDKPELFELDEPTEEELREFEQNFMDTPFMQNGILGPLNWGVKPQINHDDILKSSIDVNITLFGVEILNATLNVSNPKATVNMKIKGVGVSAELGADFSRRIVYLKGNMQLGGRTKKFDYTILSF